MAALPVHAQEPSLAQISRQLDTLAKTVRELQTTVAHQNEKIAALEEENGSLRAAAEVSSSATAVPSTSVVSASANFLPEIGVVGDIVATSTQSDEDSEGNDRFSLREIELVFGHDIDPYSRFDATIAFSDSEDPEVEEAFVSYWGLPADTNARIGRFRPRIGIASAMHRDSLETVDEPLVVQRYLGAEGLFKTGLELSNFLPTPWETVTHEVAAGIIEGGTGEDGTLFGSSTRRATYYGRLKNFWEISDSSSAQLGGTVLVGSSNEDAYANVHAFGADAIFRHRLDGIRKLTFKTEAFFQNRSEAFDPQESAGFRRHPWGMYALGEYKFLQRWAAGGRWDYVQPVDLTDPGVRASDVSWSTFLTFYQSEFARWRLQYQHINFSDAANDNRFFLQGTFAIGTHKHALQ